MEEEEDLSYLPLFITEPVYLFEEEEPVRRRSSETPAATPPEVKDKPEVNKQVKPEAAPEPVAAATETKAEKAPVAEPEAPAEGEVRAEPEAPPHRPLPFQGKNAKSIVLAIDTPPNQEQRDLLKKIMASVDITGRDVAMTDVTELENPASLPPHKLLISFGVKNPLLFRGNVPQPYEIVKIEHQTFMLADSLSVLYKDVSAKKNLWESLKKLFVA